MTLNILDEINTNASVYFLHFTFLGSSKNAMDDVYEELEVNE